MDGGSNSLTCFRPVHILNRMMLLNTHWELALQFDNKSIYVAHFTCLTFISLIFARKC